MFVMIRLVVVLEFFEKFYNEKEMKNGYISLCVIITIVFICDILVSILLLYQYYYTFYLDEY